MNLVLTKRTRHNHINSLYSHYVNFAHPGYFCHMFFHFNVFWDVLEVKGAQIIFYFMIIPTWYDRLDFCFRIRVIDSCVPEMKCWHAHRVCAGKPSSARIHIPAEVLVMSDCLVILTQWQRCVVVYLITTSNKLAEDGDTSTESHEEIGSTIVTCGRQGPRGCAYSRFE